MIVVAMIVIIIFIVHSCEAELPILARRCNSYLSTLFSWIGTNSALLLSLLTVLWELHQSL